MDSSFPKPSYCLRLLRLLLLIDMLQLLGHGDKFFLVLFVSTVLAEWDYVKRKISVVSKELPLIIADK